MGLLRGSIFFVLTVSFAVSSADAQVDSSEIAGVDVVQRETLRWSDKDIPDLGIFPEDAHGVSFSSVNEPKVTLQLDDALRKRVDAREITDEFRLRSFMGRHARIEDRVEYCGSYLRMRLSRLGLDGEDYQIEAHATGHRSFRNSWEVEFRISAVSTKNEKD